MYQRFSGARGFTPEDLRATVADLVPPDARDEMRGWLAKVLDSTDELSYAEALDWFGLQFKPLREKPRVWLGVRTRLDGQRTIVSEVRRGSPAADAGLDINDELVAVNDVEVGGKLADRLATLAPGSTITFTVQRRGTTQRINVTLGADPAQLWSLTPAPDAKGNQTTHLKPWLQD